MAAQEIFIIGNWKMNLLISDSVALATAVHECAVKHKKVLDGSIFVGIAPSYFAIPAITTALKGSPVQVGSQNICGAEKGAFTGEISSSMLKDAGGSFALIGHSDRRNIFEESNAQIATRVKGSIAAGITPVFCIGENRAERDAKKTFSVLSTQLQAVLPQLTTEEKAKLIIAYEPVWAISTEKGAAIPTKAIIQEAHGFILEESAKLGANHIRGLLYGGSVAPENVAEVLSIPEVHGGLVGGASLKAENFNPLIEYAATHLNA